MIEPVDLASLIAKGGGWRQRSSELRPPAAHYPAAPERKAVPPASDRRLGLVLDFGSSAIAAALAGGGNGVEAMFFDGKPLLEVDVGRRLGLDRSSLADNYRLDYVPSRTLTSPGETWEYDPCLKRRVELLARRGGDSGWQPAATLDVAAVCLLALARSHDAGGRPLRERLSEACLMKDFTVYLTVPNACPRIAIEILRLGVACGVAGVLETSAIPEVRTLFEAEAVAYARLARAADEPVDRTLLVVDAGAGATDASIVRGRGGELRTVAHAGLPVGGFDLDVWIASLKGAFEGLSPFEISRQLVTAREQKQLHLRQPGAGEDRRAPEQRLEELAGKLSAPDYGWPSSVPDAAAATSLAQALTTGYQRYLDLAVRGLIRALPEGELRTIDEAVISGRGSMLIGFDDALRRALAEKGPDLAPRGAAGVRERKLEVIRGAGAFASGIFSRYDRRPIRAGFEVVARSGPRELPLIAAGQPLVEGWGAAAWHLPAAQGDPAGDPRTRLDRMLLPRAVLRDLAREQLWPESDLEELLRWASMPIHGIEAMPVPAHVCVRFDFRRLGADLVVDGRRIEPSAGGAEDGVACRHPVHRLPEDWFEAVRGDHR